MASQLQTTQRTCCKKQAPKRREALHLKYEIDTSSQAIPEASDEFPEDFAPLLALKQGTSDSRLLSVLATMFTKISTPRKTCMQTCDISYLGYGFYVRDIFIITLD